MWGSSSQPAQFYLLALENKSAPVVAVRAEHIRVSVDSILRIDALGNFDGHSKLPGDMFGLVRGSVRRRWSPTGNLATRFCFNPHFQFDV